MHEPELRIDHIPDERLREMARCEVRDGLISMLNRFAHDVSHAMGCSYCGYRFGTIKQRTLAQARRAQKRRFVRYLLPGERSGARRRSLFAVSLNQA